MNDSYLYFEVLDGKALDLVKEHIAEETRTCIANSKLCEEYGAVRYYSSFTDGTVTAFGLPKPHPEFTKGNRPSPKKKTPAYERFQKQVGYDALCCKMAKELGILTNISYHGNGTIRGGRGVSRGFKSLHVLYLSEDGPFAIVISDPRPAIDELKKSGYTVDEFSENFKPELPGCRLILEEAWKLAVAQHDLAEAQAAA